MEFVWIAVFLVALVVMIKGADLFLEHAEKIGLSMGLSPFLIGVLLVGLGTSLPELMSAVFAIIKDVPEVVVANAVGSNISNILLIVGIAAVIGGVMKLKKDIVDIDLPLLAISTVIFVGVAWDATITVGESVLLILAYSVHLLYMFFHQESPEEAKVQKTAKKKYPKPKITNWILLIAGVVGLLLGAKYIVDAVVELSMLFSISPALISITAIAIGTSLPELIVSIKAVKSGKVDMAIGNIFGSNAFNALVVVGVPGLFGALPIDAQTFAIGIPVMAAATILFIITGISRRIHMWEGLMYLVFYIFFIGKLFGLL